MKMFKKRKRNLSKKIINESETTETTQVTSCTKDYNFNSFDKSNTFIYQTQDKEETKKEQKRRVFQDDDDEDILDSIKVHKAKVKKSNSKSKVSINKLGIKSSKGKEIIKKKKNLINSDAVASVQSVKTHDINEVRPKYTMDHIEQLKDSQFKSNKTASEFIQKQEIEESKEKLSDDEFDEKEVERMNQIKNIRRKKKLEQSGVAMNTNDEEFLAPKDVVMAEEEIQDLKSGIQVSDMYTMNTDKNEVILEDIGDGENWIDRQLQNALGTGNHQPTEEMLMVYNEKGISTTLPDTSEMRSIKFSMGKSVEDYTHDLCYEEDKLEKSIKNNQEMLARVEKGIISHEKDIEESTKIIQENTGNFKLLMEFSELIDDLSELLDEKADEIDHVYDNLKKLESEFLESINNIKDEDETPSDNMFNNRKAGLGFHSKAKNPKSSSENSRKILEKEHTKDIEAAQSTLEDIMKNVKSDFANPDVLLEFIKNIYRNYDKGFSFDFDIIDILDLLVPYVKKEIIENYSKNEEYGGKSKAYLTDPQVLKNFMFEDSNKYMKFIQE